MKARMRRNKNMKKVFVLTTLVALIVHFVPVDSQAWSDSKSHEFLTESAIFSAPDFNAGVRDKFGIEDGLNYAVRGKTLLEHIQNGSHLEDAKDEDIGERAKNHFHDPTKIFNEAGLDNFGFKGTSAAVWAHFEDRNLWDLKSFYDYLELSFMAGSPEDRLDNLGKTFRAAGHLMHLLQDMAVPAHTRNELYSGHTSKLLLERLLEGKFPSGSRMESYLKENPQFIRRVPAALIPTFDHFTNYFDTKSYRANTSLPVSGPSHGLAEYTNSNFLSEFQLFRDDAQIFPSPYFNPNLQNVTYWGAQWDVAKKYPHLKLVLPPIFYSKYIGRPSAVEDEEILHLGRVSFLRKYRSFMNASELIFLDDACYDEYLEKLVPKAVAYSAGLLEFLFRGDIDFEIDVSDTVPVAVTNNSAKDMDGLFTLYYETSKEVRKKVADAEWQLSIPAGGTVQVSGPAFDLPRDLGVNQTFTLVFRGTLGSVFNAVTGKTTSFAAYEFAYLHGAEYYEIQPPVPYEYFVEQGGQGPDPTGVWKRHFDCGVDFEDNLSDSTAWRSTLFTFQVMSTPAIAKKIGRSYVEDQWFTLNGNNNFTPGVLEYAKIAKMPGEWEYILDDSGMNAIVPGWTGGNPVGYVDGLWRTDTGYLDLYWNQIAANNNTDECVLEEKIARAGIVVNLYYPDYDATCSNADEIIARARSLCDNEYQKLYSDTLAMAAPYLSTIGDDEWQNYGIEVRYSRLNLLNPLKGDGTIYDSPVTFTKPYGSTELIVH
jgi:hypothetical protein